MQIRCADCDCLHYLCHTLSLSLHYLKMMLTIPFLQELRNIETNEEVKNYMFDTITQIEKADALK
jgi:hypothetical protein